MSRFDKGFAVLVGLASLWGTAASVHTQTPGPASLGFISGTVVEGEQGVTPVRRAEITLSSASLSVNRVAISDDEGHFAFDQLPAGRYALAATKPAFVRAYYGSRRPGFSAGASIAVAAGSRVQNLTIQMFRGAVLSGRVKDVRGRPQSGIPVSLLEARTVEGHRLLDPSGLTRTDDLGEYRFFGLRAGTYAVSAMATERHYEGALESTPLLWQALQSGRLSSHIATPLPDVQARRVGFAPILFPGTTDPSEALLLDLKIGEERPGVDFTVTLVPTAQVTGQVVGPDGGSLSQVQLNLTGPVEQFGYRQQVRSAVTPTTTIPVQNGGFLIDALPPGRYTLFARAASAVNTLSAGEKNSTLWAVQEFRLDDRDVTNLVVTLRQGIALHGRIAFEGQSPAGRGMVRVSLIPVSHSPFNLAVSPGTELSDGSFVLAGVSPGRYRLTVDGVPRGWSLQAARIGQLDILENLFQADANDVDGLVVTLTDRPTTLAGSLVDSQKRPVPEYRILAFPTDRALWTSYTPRIRAVRPSSDGSYTIIGLPEGDYYLIGITDEAPDDLTDPAFLTTLTELATRIRATNGSVTRLDLRVGGG